MFCVFSKGPGIFQHSFFFDNREHLMRAGANKRRSAKSGAVRARPEQIAQWNCHTTLQANWFVTYPNRAKRETAGNSFGPADRVRRGLVIDHDRSPSAPFAGPPKPALHFVEEMPKFVPYAEFAC